MEFRRVLFFSLKKVIVEIRVSRYIFKILLRKTRPKKGRMKNKEVKNEKKLRYLDKWNSRERYRKGRTEIVKTCCLWTRVCFLVARDCSVQCPESRERCPRHWNLRAPKLQSQQVEGRHGDAHIKLLPMMPACRMSTCWSPICSASDPTPSWCAWEGNSSA